MTTKILIRHLDLSDLLSHWIVWRFHFYLSLIVAKGFAKQILCLNLFCLATFLLWRGQLSIDFRIDLREELGEWTLILFESLCLCLLLRLRWYHVLTEEPTLWLLAGLLYVVLNVGFACWGVFFFDEPVIHEGLGLRVSRLHKLILWRKADICDLAHLLKVHLGVWWLVLRNRLQCLEFFAKLPGSLHMWIPTTSGDLLFIGAPSCFLSWSLCRRCALALQYSSGLEAPQWQLSRPVRRLKEVLIRYCTASKSVLLFLWCTIRTAPVGIILIWVWMLWLVDVRVVWVEGQVNLLHCGFIYVLVRTGCMWWLNAIARMGWD